MDWTARTWNLGMITNLPIFRDKESSPVFANFFIYVQNIHLKSFASTVPWDDRNALSAIALPILPASTHGSKCVRKCCPTKIALNVTGKMRNLLGNTSYRSTMKAEVQSSLIRPCSFEVCDGVPLDCRAKRYTCMSQPQQRLLKMISVSKTSSMALQRLL